MHFVALTVSLRPRDQHRLTVVDSLNAHAAIFTAITAVDREIGQHLHDMRQHKRITLGIVERRRSTALLRLGFMAQEGLAAAHLLINALAQEPILRISRTICDVANVNIDHGPWSGISTWTDLATEAPGRHLRFYFVTPTAIAKRDTSGERFFSLFPDPLDIFSGLARRWQALEGPPLPTDLTDFVRAGGCVPANYDLRTIAFQTSERTQIGFVGSVVYECRKSSSQHLNALHALTRLAFFTGIGYQTARGMGLTQTSIAE